MLDRELPEVSIIVLTYNGRKYLDGLLPSLIDQTYPSLKREIIVIDNGSADDTVSHIRRHYSEIKCIALSQNIGFAAGNNIGYQHAKHDFIVFLNQDTICHQNWLHGLVAPLLDDHDIGACASNIIPVDPGQTAGINRQASPEMLVYCDLSPFGYGRYHEEVGTALKYTLLVSGCSFITRREIITELGYLFDHKIWMYAEDTDLSLRILGLGKKLCTVRDSVVYHLHDPNSRLTTEGIRKAYGAIHNRVYVYLKNMPPAEFLFYFPLMVIGGGGKLFELQIPHRRKAIFFLPFCLFSFIAMLIALLANIIPLLIHRQNECKHDHSPRSLISLLLKQTWKSLQCNGKRLDENE